MKAPFVLPVSFDTHWETISDAAGRTISCHESGDASPEVIAFTVYALNMHERMAAAIIELRDATDAEMAARPGSAYQHHLTLRRLLDARRAINQLAKEISDDR